MKCLIFYFTGSGNTQKIANLYQESFFKENVPTTLFLITRIHESLPDVQSFDYLGIAFPIHAFNSPLILEEFVKELPKVEAKPYFIISTCGEPLHLNDCASSNIERILKKKGYFLTNEYHYCMPYNIMFRHPEDMAKKMYDTARALVPYHVKEILGHEASLYFRPIYASIVKTVLAIEQPAMRLNGHHFKVDMDKCIRCMKCVNNCTASNITYDGTAFHFGKHCNMCTRCAFMCPKNAISIGMLNNWRVNGEYRFAIKEEDSHDHENYLKKSYDRYFEEAVSFINHH